jgi:hypothetical protein
VDFQEFQQMMNGGGSSFISCYNWCFLVL